jgi:hypothetical protein
MSDNNNDRNNGAPLARAPKTSPVLTSGTFSHSVVKGNGLGINGTSVQTGDINPHKQENHNQFFNPVINYFHAGSSQSSLTRTNDEQQPPTQVQAQARAHPLAVDAEHRQEEHAQAGKHEAEKQRLLKRTGGCPTCTLKCALIALAVVVVLAISLGVGLGVGLPRRDRGQDGTSSRYVCSLQKLLPTISPVN